MKLVFLGTGGTYPSKKRNVTSIAIQLPGEVLMFDCGEGTQRQLMRSSISFMKIRKIFISHLHADHFLGIPGLVQSMSLNGREDDLTVYGPKGTADNVRAMMELGYFKSGFKVLAKDLRGGATLKFGGYSVRTAQAEHTIPSIAYSVEENPRQGKFDLNKAKTLGIPEGPLYRKLQSGRQISFNGRTILPEAVLGPERRGRKVVYSGDTKPSNKVIALSEDADVLIHDCTLGSPHASLARQFGHSTATEAARAAKKAGVGMLFLVHFSPRYDSTEELQKEASQVFEHAVAAEDLMEYVVKFRD